MIRMLVIFGIVTVIALAAATTAGAVIIRRALAPLRRVAQTASEVVELAVGPRRGRTAGAGARIRRQPVHRGGSTRVGAQPDARPHRGRAVGAAGQRDPGPPVRRRRQSRTAHAAGRDPRLHRTHPTHGRRPRGGGARDEPGRIRDRADDAPGRGPAAAGPAGLRPAAGTRTGRPVAAGGRRGQRRPRRRDRITSGSSTCPRSPWSSPATRHGCTRC